MSDVRNRRLNEYRKQHVFETSHTQSSETQMNANLADSPLTDAVLERIAAPIETGTGLPNDCYTSEEWLRLENKHLFATKENRTN